MRPTGVIREALRGAMPGIQPGTWMEMARFVPRLDVRCPSEMKLLRRTVVNMAREGELRVAGEKLVPHSRRPMTVYAAPRAPLSVAVQPLQRAVWNWWR